jgi:UDP-N-acetylmuramoyl-L-alanyl-D-glutamate--2,6-diaminopimelate ligase
MPDHTRRPGEVPPQRLAGLLDRLPAGRIEGDPNTPVTGISHDSRAVRPGDLYLARAGEHTHGIDHVDAALRSGAVAVLTDPASARRAVTAGAAAVVVTDDPRAVTGATAAWVYGDPANDLLLIGVTGTNGKTTTVSLIEAGLRAGGRRTGLIGTIETRIGDEVLPSARTTPEATDLHALFAVMRERAVDAVAMEVSSHALVLGRVDGVRFDVAAFTNLSQDHLDFHVDMADYFAAKASLFTPERARQGVICTDDRWGAALVGQAAVPTTTVGRDPRAQWRRVEDHFDAAGGTTRVVDPDGVSHDVRCRLAGEVNLANAAVAFVTLVRAGISPRDARRGIADVDTVPGRMERIEAGQPYAVLVDYAHTPSAVAAVLAAARGLAAPAGRVIVVLGCGGDRDRAKRPGMAASAVGGSDLAIFTSDNPRSEDPNTILAAMLAGVPDRSTVVVEADRRAAIGLAVARAAPGDVVVIAGKGHEQGQEVAGVVTDFDDRAVARAALAAQAGVAS